MGDDPGKPYTRTPTQSLSTIQVSQSQISIQRRSAKIASAGSRIPSCRVYLDQTHSRKKASLPAQPGKFRAAADASPRRRGLRQAEDSKLRANRRGSVVRRNHFGALVPRGLCSAARGNICHSNLGLRYSWLIVARVQVCRDLGVGLARCRLRLYQVAVNRRVARAERTTTGESCQKDPDVIGTKSRLI